MEKFTQNISQDLSGAIRSLVKTSEQRLAAFIDDHLGKLLDIVKEVYEQGKKRHEELSDKIDTIPNSGLYLTNKRSGSSRKSKHEDSALLEQVRAIFIRDYLGFLLMDLISKYFDLVCARVNESEGGNAAMNDSVLTRRNCVAVMMFGVENKMTKEVFKGGIGKAYGDFRHLLFKTSCSDIQLHYGSSFQNQSSPTIGNNQDENPNGLDTLRNSANPPPLLPLPDWAQSGFLTTKVMKLAADTLRRRKRL